MSDLLISARVGLAFAIGSVLAELIIGHWSAIFPAVLFGTLGAYFGSALKDRP